MLCPPYPPRPSASMPTPQCRSGYRLNTLLSATRFIIATIYLAVWIAPVGGQTADQTAAPPPPQDNPYAAVLHVSEEASTLLKRAEDGIERQDWKLAIDSLQRIVELPGEHILSGDGRLYECARDLAIKRIGQLPEPGLRTYRLVHDGEAAALFDRARQQHDPAALKTIVDRFVMTRVGPQAAVTQADWMMDAGRFDEAASLLGKVQSLRIPSDLPEWVIPARLAVALTLSGQPRRGRQTLDRPTATRPGDARTASSPALEHIGAWLKHQGTEPVLQRRSAWPFSQGDPARTGRMDAVEPTFTADRNRRVPLGVLPPREGLDAIQSYAAGRGWWPAARPVTDGRTLYLKAGGALTAIDLETFEPLWSSQPLTGDPFLARGRTEPQPMWIIQPDEPARQYDNHPFVREMYRDNVGSSVSLAFGLALTVEWPGEPPPVPALWLDDGRPDIVQVQFDAGRPAPNRIAAYNAATGKLEWSTDSAGGEGEPAGLQFLSPPIPLGPSLLAPARVQNDLYAVLLDPATGRLTRHVYLCGVGGGVFDSLQACEPCIADGTVYLPTSRGALAALDASDASIRWILRYDKTARKTSSTCWQAPQAVAASDLLLLAPPDADQLLCIDRVTARIRWTAERKDLQCIIAASDQLVWLGGRQIVALDLSTGRPAWVQPVSRPSGRPILSGDRLYVPTEAGLVAIEAATGKQIDILKPLPGDRLANLLAFDSALFVADGFSIRKVHDLNQGYQQAVAVHRADPADGSKAIRLASMELLRDRPADALAALEHVPPAFAQQDPHRHRHLAHLRVSAMLKLAAADSTTPDRARTLLEQARQTAATSRDTIDTALALADFHFRQGRPLDACLTHLSLMLSSAGDDLVSESDDFERRAREMAGDRLTTALARLSPDRSAEFTRRTRDRLNAAATQHEEHFVLWLSECDACGPVAHQAALQLAAWAIEAGRFEAAETLLIRVLRHADAPGLKAEAAARLATIYLQPEDLHQPVAAAELLDRLADDFASETLSDSILHAFPGFRAESDRSTASLTAGRIASRLRSLLDSRLLADHRRQLAPVRLGPPLSSTPTLNRNARPVVLHNEPLEPLLGKRLLLADRARLEVLDIADQKLLWPVELRLLNELTVQSQTEQESMPQPFPRPGSPYISRAKALLEGQTLLINSPLGLHAVGALTGRRLWSRLFDAPCLPNQDPADSDAWFWAEDGFLATVDAGSRLEVCHTESGQRILWRRTSPRRRWHWVRARGGFLAAMDADLEQVDLFRVRDGTAVGRCLFTQPPDKVSVTLYSEVICGPTSEREVAAFELAAPGVQRWRFAMPDVLAQVFKPTPDLLAVSDQAGRLALVDPATGTSRWQTTVEACAEGVTDGMIQGDTLYVCGLQKRPRGPRPDHESQRWGVAAVNAADGRVLWQRGDLAARTHLNAAVLRISENAIPLAAFFPARGNAAQQFPPPQGTDRTTPLVSRVEIIVLDKATGRQLGGSLSANLADNYGAGLILDLRSVPGGLDIVVGVNYLRCPCPPASP